MPLRTRAFLACLILLATPQAALSEDAWTFKVIPYVWTPAMSGDVAAIPGTPTAPVDLSSVDVIKNLDIAGFVVGEARHGNLFIRSELQYSSISDKEDMPGPLFSDAKVTSKTFMGALAVGYTFLSGPDYSVGAFAGGRLWSLDTEIKFGSGLLASRKVSHTETFVDPIVGASASYQFAPKWSVAATGSIGGFGVAADLEWGLTGGVTYQAGESWGVVLGYRYISLDYEDDGFVYDVEMYGPILGVTFDF